MNKMVLPQLRILSHAGRSSGGLGCLRLRIQRGRARRVGGQTTECEAGHTVLAKVRASIPPQAFIARLEVKGEMRELGLPPEALTPSYGTEAWMPLESIGRTQPGLMLPPLSRATFEQLGMDMETSAGGPGAGRINDGDGEGSFTTEAAGASGLHDGGGGGVGRRLPLTAHQDWRLRRAIMGLHTWLGALACGQGHTLCNDLLPDEAMPLMLEDAPLPSREEQERRLLGTLVSRM
ncbi:hypothetical protein Vretifemale_20357 [Volvox reticuliferus]|uniref:Uncharacterized protein n=1 Tax=Volvox reticuliferus TaxID=1737510 RepID=A0A8J4D0L5_9CHLO|nr:hypothetical protein Vretifemale_20357 [Volvox reticuliferus]